MVALSYARIFFRNAVDGGFLLPLESQEPLHRQIRTGDTVSIDVERAVLTHEPTGRSYSLKPIGDVEAIVRAGGLFGYARQLGMIQAKEQVGK